MYVAYGSALGTSRSPVQWVMGLKCLRYEDCILCIVYIVYYSGIKIFNNLPHNIKDLANEIVLFWNALKRFLLMNSFYNNKEYFNYQRYSIEN